MNKNQQKILLLAGIVFGVILVFWVFVYSPKNKQMRELRDRFNKVQGEIDKVQRMTGDDTSLDVLISKYDKKLKECKRKLPEKEEVVLRELARNAVRMGIQVVSITPARAINSDLPVSVEGCLCKELDISIHLVGSYVKIGKYLGVIESKFPFILRLKRIDLKKEGEEKGVSKLEAFVDVTLYMLIPA